MGLMFYPRGGSAQVVRYLSRALVESGWDVALAAGSLGSPGEQTHAATFFEGLDVEVADYTPALERFGRGEDQLAGPVPFHGSFEDREGAPDPVFASLSPEQAESQVSAWEGVLEHAGFGNSDLIQLHHLTPMHEAAARLWPQRSLVTHLHGTELRMLDRIERLDAAAVALGTSLKRLPATVASDDDGRLPERERELLQRTNLSRYRYGKDWAARLEASARQSQRIICLSPFQASDAVRLLGVPDHLIEVISNGVDTALFNRSALTREQRLNLLRHWLVDDPQRLGRNGAPREYPLPAGGDGYVHGPRGRAASPSPVRRPLRRLQARPAPHTSVRPGTTTLQDPGAAPDLGRLARRVGGRAPAHGREGIGCGWCLL